MIAIQIILSLLGYFVFVWVTSLVITTTSGPFFDVGPIPFLVIVGAIFGPVVLPFWLLSGFFWRSGTVWRWLWRISHIAPMSVGAWRLSHVTPFSFWLCRTWARAVLQLNPEMRWSNLSYTEELRWKHWLGDEENHQ